MKKTACNIVLVGLGPHARRIYIASLCRLGVYPKLIIDIESSRGLVMDFVKDKGIVCDFYFVSDINKDLRKLSRCDEDAIDLLLAKNKINKAIVATEPKAHLAYCKYFLSRKIPVLMDKPVSVIKNSCLEIKKARQIYNDYKYLRGLSNQFKTSCVIQSQRRYHDGYRFIYNLIKDTIDKYMVPISHIDIYHCDGQWNMPEEYLTRENHSFFNGYGKVMHSGYHFVDFASWIVPLNNRIRGITLDNVCVIHQTTKPADQIFQLKSAYTKLFKESVIKPKGSSCREMGELDSYSIIKFRDGKRIVTTANINLLHSGFSRRESIEQAQDLYKGNGRVRHERINIHLGPILNIQVHSYQSYEIKDSSFLEEESGPGGLDHFDIYIFKNPKLIGGAAFQEIKFSNRKRINRQTTIGHNEEARIRCTLDWLDGRESENDIKKHQMTNLILSTMYQCSAMEYSGIFPYREIRIPRNLE